VVGVKIEVREEKKRIKRKKRKEWFVIALP
jgi:hypothetical protein